MRTLNAALKQVDEPVEPMFHTAQDAIRFALTRVGRPSRPLMNTMTDRGSPSGTIGGLDAAAQAGMVMGELRRNLSPLHLAVLIAHTAPHAFPCSCRSPCCSGRRVNWEWRDAIDTIARAAYGSAPCKASAAVRLAIVGKLYGEGATIRQLAERLEYDRHTIGDHHRLVLRWLRGAPPGRNGEAPIDGIEANAWRRAECVLCDAGIVG